MASTGSDKKIPWNDPRNFLFILPANCEFLRLQLVVGFVFDGGYMAGAVHLALIFHRKLSFSSCPAAILWKFSLCL